MVDAVLNLIISQNLAFDIVEKPAFQHLLKVLDSKVDLPKKTAVMSLLINQDLKIRQNLKVILEKQDYVCTTCDVWSYRCRSFLGMSVHFVDKDSLQRKYYILAFRIMKKNQDFDYIGRILYAVHKAYGIENKIRFTVTDGENNICKSFREFAGGDFNSNYFGTPSDEDEIIFVKKNKELLF